MAVRLSNLAVLKNFAKTSPWVKSSNMVNDIEKVSAERISSANIEHVDSLPPTKGVVDIDDDEEYTYEEQRKIIHRVDRRLVIIVGAAYCISLMDRTNVSVAAITG